MEEPTCGVALVAIDFLMIRSDVFPFVGGSDTLSALSSLPMLNFRLILLCGILLAVFSLLDLLRIFPLRTAGTARGIT
jgi:L-cystine uptake protein TcyP (sodium:dicarboxylate symporter family)